MLCEKSYSVTDIALIVCGIVTAMILCATAQYISDGADKLAPNVLRLAAVFIMARVLIRQ